VEDGEIPLLNMMQLQFILITVMIAPHRSGLVSSVSAGGWKENAVREWNGLT
jgi:hypothetical protein